MNFKVLFAFFICVFSQLTLSKADDLNSPVETLVVFCHGMGETAQHWEDGYNQFIKDMYKREIPNSTIEKGRLVAVFPEGPLNTNFFGVRGKQWFTLPDGFRDGIKHINTEVGLVNYLNVEESGLMDSAGMLVDHVNHLLETYQLTTDNLVLMGYSQGGMIASMVSQHLDGNCRSLVMINAPYVPDENAISYAQTAYLTYGTRDNLLPQHVFEISTAALIRHVGESNVNLHVVENLRHDPDPERQGRWIFESIELCLTQMKIVR